MHRPAAGRVSGRTPPLQGPPTVSRATPGGLKRPENGTLWSIARTSRCPPFGFPVWRTCWQQQRSTLDLLSQLIRGAPVTLALPALPRNCRPARSDVQAVGAVSSGRTPCRRAFRATFALPLGVRGPLDRPAFQRLASTCLAVVTPLPRGVCERAARCSDAAATLLLFYPPQGSAHHRPANGLR
jgi:hypothetical protein